VETPADNVAAPSVAGPENSSSGPTGDAEYELFKGLGSPQAPKNAPKRPGDPIPPPTKPVTTPGSPATGQGGTSSAQSKTGTETTPGPKPAPGILLPGDEGYR